MKKIIIAAFVCLTSLNVLGQKVALSRVAELNIPVEAKPVVREKLYDSKQKSDRSIIALSKDRDGVYEIGSVIIQVTPLEGRIDKSSFKDMEEDFIANKNNSTFFKLTKPNIQNATAVYTQYEPKNSTRGRYVFMAINATYTRQLTVLIEYDNADRDKADKIYEHILKSIKMK